LDTFYTESEAPKQIQTRKRKERKKKRKERKKKSIFPGRVPKGVQKDPSRPGRGPNGDLVAQRNKKERKKLPTLPYLFICALFSCEQIEPISGLGY
jgi:hypothetical protein